MSAKAGLVDIVDNYPVYINTELCKGCGLCAKKCPAESINGKKKEPHIINQEKCIQCGQCIKSCKFNAILLGTEKIITLVNCECCGVPFATRQQLEYITARTGIDCYEVRLCADCRKKKMAVQISQFAG